MSRRWVSRTVVVLLGGMLAAGSASSSEQGVAGGIVADQTAALVTIPPNDCKVGKIAFATAGFPGIPTTSTDFIDVPDMSISVKTLSKACLIVQFTANTWAPTSNGLMQARALLDGTVVGAPGVIQLSGDDGLYAGAHAFNFVFTNILAGTHTVTMQFRSVSGSTVVMNFRSMLVHHR